jgi:hypothetical protein
MPGGTERLRSTILKYNLLIRQGSKKTVPTISCNLLHRRYAGSRTYAEER